MKLLRRLLSPTLLALLIACGPPAFNAIERIQTISTNRAAISGPNDPDPWMRLSLVREWLSGNEWFNHDVARSNAPEGGIASPWTRPLDMVIASLVTLQPGGAPLDTKLLNAAAILPVLWMTLLVLGLCDALRNMRAHTISYAMLPLLLLVAPVIHSYFGSGNADHHAPLAALWAWVMALGLRTHPPARLQGLLLALMLWISPEALFLIAVVLAWELGRWLWQREGLDHLRRLTTTLVLSTLIALAIERPPHAWLVPIYDSLSIVHGLLMALCALAVQAFAILPERFTQRRTGRMLAAKLAGTILVAVMALCYPLFFRGPMAQAAPFIFTEFLPQINEAQSIMAKSSFYAASLLLLPLCVLFAYFRLCFNRQTVLPRSRIVKMLFWLLALIIFANIQMRWYYYLTPLATLMAAAWMGYLFLPPNSAPVHLPSRWPEWLQTITRMLLLSLALAVPATLFALSREQYALVEKHRSCASYAHLALRDGSLAGALGDAPLTLLAPADFGAEILFFTPYRIIASNYHREGEGLRYLWDAQRITEAGAMRQHLVQRQVQAIFFCPDRSTAPDSLLRRWWHHKEPLPAWATRVALPTSYPAHAPMVLRIH